MDWIAMHLVYFPRPWKYRRIYFTTEYDVILTLSKRPWYRGHEIKILDRGRYKHYNHAFSFSQKCMGVEKNTF